MYAKVNKPKREDVPKPNGEYIDGRESGEYIMPQKSPGEYIDVQPDTEEARSSGSSVHKPDMGHDNGAFDY